MTTFAIDLYEADDPNGTPVVSLTDADIEPGPIFRDAENEVGSISFRVRRDHPDANGIAAGMYAQVTIAACGEDPVFGGWLDNRQDVVIGSEEESSEVIETSGPGAIAILRHATLLDDLHAPAPPASVFRGNYNVDGKWTWEGEPYGAILTRVIEEGQNQPGVPLDAVTIDFDRTDDSNSVGWQSFNGIVETDIGTDGLTMYSTLIDSGYLYVRCDPDLAIHAYAADDYGTDRSSTTFGTGKVRFVKGVNIVSELTRDVETRMARGRARPLNHATHAIVTGKDFSYVQVVSGSYTSGKGRWITVPYPESNDVDLLTSVGEEALRRGEQGLEAIVFEILPGDDEAAGRYTPYVHFDIGDLVTLHTGSEAGDYDQVTARLTGISFILPEATDDAQEALSGRWVIELNGGRSRYSTASPAPQVSCCGCTVGELNRSDDPEFGIYLGRWNTYRFQATSDGQTTFQLPTGQFHQTQDLLAWHIESGLFLDSDVTNVLTGEFTVPSPGIPEGEYVQALWRASCVAEQEEEGGG